MNRDAANPELLIIAPRANTGDITRRSQRHQNLLQDSSVPPVPC